MLHQRSDGEPHRVDQGEVVDQDSGFFCAGVRIVPLVRAESERYFTHVNLQFYLYLPKSHDVINKY